MQPESYNSLSEAVASVYGEDIRIESRHAVSGGDINRAYVLDLSDGRSVFLKENTKSNLSFFSAESSGLKAIRDTRCIRVPEVHAYGTCEDTAFLLMEYSRETARSGRFWEDFANALADMHEADTSLYTPGGAFGFTEDNFIGAGEQINTVKSSWTEFFRDCRLLPQFEKARYSLSPDDCKKMDLILDNLDKYLVEPLHPSLLHGDLWGGNFITGSDGNAWLIDPAVYVGHAEADIAMTELFGGFSGSFYRTYASRGLLQEGYEKRRDIYNLYHMLNHLNLFGSGYLGSVQRIIRGVR